jgi:hypothetical protein
LIGFIARCHQFGLPRATAVEGVLNGLEIQRDIRRTAIDDAPNGGAVAFAEGRDAEHMTKSITGHGISLSAHETGGVSREGHIVESNAPL